MADSRRGLNSGDPFENWATLLSSDINSRLSFQDEAAVIEEIDGMALFHQRREFIWLFGVTVRHVDNVLGCELAQSPAIVVGHVSEFEYDATIIHLDLGGPLGHMIVLRIEVVRLLIVVFDVTSFVIRPLAIDLVVWSTHVVRPALKSDRHEVESLPVELIDENAVVVINAHVGISVKILELLQPLLALLVVTLLQVFRRVLDRSLDEVQFHSLFVVLIVVDLLPAIQLF